MKKIFVILSFMFLITATYSQIKIIPSGNVGIGVTANSSYKLDICGMTRVKTVSTSNGIIINNEGLYGSPAIRPEINYSCNIGTSTISFAYIYYNNLLKVSDVRMKENVREMNNALDKILKLNAVQYDLKKDFFINNDIKDEKILAKLDIERKNNAGFLAQDVIKVLPSIVHYDDSTDVYSIDYTKLIPYLVKAIQEQQAMIDDLKKKSDKGMNYKSAEVATGIDDNTIQTDKPYLEQNVPNPFSDATTINFYIPENSQKATIYIYDMQGLQKKVFPVTTRGKLSITINGTELQAGMYMYSLIVDGKEVDTKRLILTN